MGLSFAGLSPLALSSVMPGTLPDPDTFGSEPDAIVSMFVVADLALVGEEVDCASRALWRLLLPGLLVDEGCDLLLSIDGGEYE